MDDGAVDRASSHVSHQRLRMEDMHISKDFFLGGQMGENRRRGRGWLLDRSATDEEVMTSFVRNAKRRSIQEYVMSSRPFGMSQYRREPLHHTPGRGSTVRLKLKREIPLKVTIFRQVCRPLFLVSTLLTVHARFRCYTMYYTDLCARRL